MSLGRALSVGSGWWLHSQVHFGFTFAHSDSQFFPGHFLLHVPKQYSCSWFRVWGRCLFRLPSSWSGWFWLMLAASSTAVSSAVSIRKFLALAGTWLKYEAVTIWATFWDVWGKQEQKGVHCCGSCSNPKEQNEVLSKIVIVPQYNRAQECKTEVFHTTASQYKGKYLCGAS